MPNECNDRAARDRAVSEIVMHLAKAEYDQVKAKAPRSRISPEQMSSAIETYGRNLLPLPERAFENIDYVAIFGSQPAAYSVVVPLFTREEGRSDLPLELKLISTGAGCGYEIEVENLHVL